MYLINSAVSVHLWLLSGKEGVKMTASPVSTALVPLVFACLAAQLVSSLSTPPSECFCWRLFPVFTR